MKKLFAVFFIGMFIIISDFMNEFNFKNLSEFFNITSVYIYSSMNNNQNIFTVNKNTNEEDITLLNNNGVDNIYKIEGVGLSILYNQDIDYCGLEINFKKGESLTKLIFALNAKIVKFENLCDRKIIYAYSNSFGKFVLDNGCKINFQICIYENEFKLGYPLLLGSY